MHPPLLHISYTLVSHLQHLYYTFVTPLLHPCGLLHIYYTFVTSILYMCYTPFYTFATPLLHIYYTPCNTFVTPLLHICISIRKPDGKLTETPEETFNELIKHHFKDNTNISDTHVNVTLQERSSSTTAEHKMNDKIFPPNRAKKAVQAFSPLTAAGPDGIRPIMLQRGWEYISDAFIAIAKKSFSLGYTPKTWRASTSIFFTKTE